MKKIITAFALMATVLTPAHAAPRNPSWLSHAVFYQIYPSSFMDSNDDGIGDLRGIQSRLGYLKQLGITAIWLNPIFESGWFDGGYDVIDFYKVDPRFGSNSDLVSLVSAAHAEGLKVCLDLVAGHTSNRCAWFKQSATGGADDRYADYYIWTDTISPKDQQDIVARHQAPNPLSSTTGKYVEADAKRGKYYLKNYFECQPALNYGYAHPNPAHPWEQAVDAPGPQAVRRELRNIMAFWFDKGVDGFRVDLASSLVKDDPDKEAVMALWHEMRQWKDQHYPDRVFISEWANPPKAIAAGFDIDFMIQFGIPGYGSLFFAPDTPWGQRLTKRMGKATPCYFDKAGRGSIKEFIDNFSNSYTKTKGSGYIAIPTANHDFQRPNIGTRCTTDQLKVAMTFFLTMPGVPLIYYGDEIGMRYQEGLPSKEGSNDRGGSRTPMQWLPGPTAGFSSCEPAQLYLPVATDGGRLTVAAEENDPQSLLRYTQALIALRQHTPALANDGDWQLVSDVNRPYPMVYRRTTGTQQVIVALNPSGRKVSAPLAVEGQPRELLRTGRCRLGHDRLVLGPCSAVVIAVSF